MRFFFALCRKRLSLLTVSIGAVRASRGKIINRAEDCVGNFQPWRNYLSRSPLHNRDATRRTHHARTCDDRIASDPASASAEDRAQLFMAADREFSAGCHSDQTRATTKAASVCFTLCCTSVITAYEVLQIPPPLQPPPTVWEEVASQVDKPERDSRKYITII